MIPTASVAAYNAHDTHLIQPKVELMEDEGYSEEFLAERQSHLEESYAEITGRSRETLQQIMEQDREVGDSVDTSNEEQGTSTLLRLKDREVGQLRRIREALERLNSGEYGECVECGEFINPRRLKAQPTAQLCIECKEEREEAERRQRVRPGLIDEYM